MDDSHVTKHGDPGAVITRERPSLMRSRRNLWSWIKDILPAPAPADGSRRRHFSLAQCAAGELVRAMLLGFTTELSALARQLERKTVAKHSRQYLGRWLNRAQWNPEQIYTRLFRRTRRMLSSLKGSAVVPILIDATDLQDRWVTLQASVPWQRRALPLYRATTQYEDPKETLPEMLGRTLVWLKRNLPGPRRRYVLVMDRGFPSHALLAKLHEDGWRYVLRVKGNWKLEHPEFTGLVRDMEAQHLVGPDARLFLDGVFGQPAQAHRWSRTHLVVCRGAETQEAWLLLTNLTDAQSAIELYRQRMRIEEEFRDVKGPAGIDHLATWTSLERVDRFLAWVAVYEWRLAFLWITHDLEEYAETLEINAKLSWMRVVRTWLAQQQRSAMPLGHACL